jgi:hypothetical protein
MHGTEPGEQPDCEADAGALGAVGVENGHRVIPQSLIF